MPETYWVDQDDEVRLSDILSQRGWHSAVAKPTVGAIAHGIRRVSVRDHDATVRGPALVQQFLPEIQDEGEWSLIFIAGEFSHAVRKLPATADFRVQTQFGGSTQATRAESHIIDKASSVLELIGEIPLYARVDGIERGGELLLMELELIEPVLFLGLGGAAKSLAQKINDVVQDSHHAIK